MRLRRHRGRVQSGPRHGQRLEGDSRSRGSGGAEEARRGPDQRDKRPGDRTAGRYGQELIHFHFKYTIRPDGSGVDDVKLICSSFANTCPSVEILRSVSVAFTPSVNDVYGAIPVLHVVTCRRSRVDTGSEQFLPYAIFKHDDYRLTMPTD